MVNVDTLLFIFIYLYIYMDGMGNGGLFDAEIGEDFAHRCDIRGIIFSNGNIGESVKVLKQVMTCP